MTKTTDERETPQPFFDALDEEFHFDIDVCASEENTKVADCFIDEDTDALITSWGGFFDLAAVQPREHITAWCNPPYSNITPWVTKAIEEQAWEVTTVALLPASVSSKWFHAYIWSVHKHGPQTDVEIRFPTKRLVFGPHFTGAKWPSMVVIFRAL